jgi:MFS family permease
MRRSSVRFHRRMPWRILGPLVGCAFTMGVLLGGAEVATVAFCEELRVTQLSGAALAVWAVGSLVSGVATGALHVQSSMAVRFRWSMIALGGLVVPLPFVTTFPALAACLFVSGFAISPTLVTAFARIEEAVPVNRMTEGITLFTTGLGVGLAPGAAISGWIAESSGASAAFWVPVSAGLVGAATAVVAWLTVSGGGSVPNGLGEQQMSGL